MDYKLLLEKYLRRVLDCEGTDYVDSGLAYNTRDLFSEEELTELRRLSEKAIEGL